MPIGTKDTMKIYDPRVASGYVETLQDKAAIWNEVSNGALKMLVEEKEGEFDYSKLWTNTGPMVSRRDPTNMDDVEAKALAEDESVAVKINRKIGPVATTLDAFKKAGHDADEDTLLFVAGQQAGAESAIDYARAGLLSLGASLQGAATKVNIVGETTETMHTKALMRALAVMGDASDRIVAWVMHSGTFFDLVGDQYDTKITGIANLVVANASPLTLNRPVLVLDNDALVTTVGAGSAAVDHYYTFGLTESAVELTKTEEEAIFVEGPITGKENLYYQMQGEYAFNVRVKGHKWDVANGGANPTDTALATTTNWDAILDSHKNFGGVCIESLVGGLAA